MKYDKMAEELKREYVLKFDFKKELLEKVKSLLNNSEWSSFSKTSFGGSGKEKYTGKVNDQNEFIIDGPDNQYDMNDSNKLINNEYVKNIVKDKHILKTLEAYFKEKPKLNKKKLNIFYTRNLDGNMEQIRKQGWHIDDPGKMERNEKYKFIKLFIPLCDVDETNGVTHIIKGSHDNLPKGIKLGKKIQGKRWGDDFVYKHYDKKLLVTLKSKFGEVFLTRNDGFHKGGFCKEGSRIMIIAEYYVK